MLKRAFAYVKNLGGYSGEQAREVSEPFANLVSSRVERVDVVPFNGGADKNYELHLPVLDLDYDVQLVPSSTPGHFHLYLNRPVSWGQYVKVLRALAEAGLVEHGWAEASIRQGASFVRKPGEPKEETPVLEA